MAALKELFELDRINGYAYDSVKQSKWKETTQRYISNLLIKNLDLQKDVLNLDYSISNTVNFLFE